MSEHFPKSPQMPAFIRSHAASAGQNFQGQDTSRSVAALSFLVLLGSPPRLIVVAPCALHQKILWTHPWCKEI